MRRWTFVGLAVCAALSAGCAGRSRLTADEMTYPKASPDADRVLPLASSVDGTRLAVDGKLVGTVNRSDELKILVNRQPHTVTADAPDYPHKEAFIQPPYDGVSTVSFNYTYNERLSQVPPADNTNQKPMVGEYPLPVASTGTPHIKPFTAQISAGKRVALVIGNSTYQSVGALPNPKRDAEEVAKRLKIAGFSLLHPIHSGQDVQSDLTREEMRKADKALEQAAQSADVVLLYYAGHGLQVDGLPFLVPVDMPPFDPKLMATAEGKSAVESHLVKLDDLIQGLDQHSTLTVTVFDACREIPALETKRSLTSGGPDTNEFRGLSRPQSQGKHRILAFSAGFGELATDGAQHSPYTEAFMREFDENPNQTMTDFFMHIQGRVTKATGQTPEFITQGSVPTDIYLVP